MTTTTATTAITAMTTRRGKFSTGFSVLLLCAALLLTKSCGIMAFSGENGDATVGLPAAWSDANILDVAPAASTTNSWTDDSETGSGEELTTLEPSTPEQLEEETTTTSVDESETTTNVVTNEDEAKDETTTIATNSEPDLAETTTTISNDATAEADATTDLNEAIQPSASTEQVVITSAEPNPSTLAPIVFQCEKAGLFVHTSGDCKRYHSCLLNTLTGQLEVHEQTCPESTVYSSIYQRCTRDLATCNDDGFTCSAVGRFAGSDDTHYYNCVASLLGGYHKYLVRCSSGERYEPTLAACWRYEWTNLSPDTVALEASDLAAIKREQKQLKSEEKLRQKAQKSQDKLLRKQQKDLEKQAQKLAKEQAKQQAKKEKQKQKAELDESVESVEVLQSPKPENYQCVSEGNFARTNSHQYFACVSQKGKLLTLPMDCCDGQSFDAQLGVCLRTVAVV